VKSDRFSNSDSNPSIEFSFQKDGFKYNSRRYFSTGIKRLIEKNIKRQPNESHPIDWKWECECTLGYTITLFLVEAGMDFWMK
jgi:hypothetical protein